MHSKALLLVVCLTLVCRGTAATKQEEEDLAKFDREMSRVFAKSGGERIEPQNLRPILTDLWKLGTKLDKVPETVKVIRLYNLGNLSSKKCASQQDIYKPYEEALAENSEYQVNIVPYLGYYKKQLTGTCKIHLRTQVIKAVLALGKQKAAHIVSMMGTIANFLPQQRLRPPVSAKILEKGLALVFKVRSDVKWRQFSYNDGDKVDDAVFKEFGRLVEHPCLEVLSLLNKAIDVYYNLPENENLSSQANWANVVDWVNYSCVCRDIIDEMRQIDSSDTIELIENIKYRLTGKKFESTVGAGLAQHVFSPPRSPVSD